MNQLFFKNINKLSIFWQFKSPACLLSQILSFIAGTPITHFKWKTIENKLLMVGLIWGGLMRGEEFLISLYKALEYQTLIGVPHTCPIANKLV